MISTDQDDAIREHYGRSLLGNPNATWTEIKAFVETLPDEGVIVPRPLLLSSITALRRGQIPFEGKVAA